MKTSKLCVIDLASIIESVSGCDPIESPTDQALLPGVKEAIDRYRADGWHLAIVSNQGACDWLETKAEYLAVGQRFQIPEDEEDCNPFLGDTFTVVSTIKEVVCSQECMTVETGSQDFTFGEDDRVLVQCKTIESAIEEVEFAADLCAIEEAYFCPDVSGKTMYDLGKVTGIGWRSMMVSEQDFEYLTGSTNPKHRLPDMGMLTYAKSARVFPVSKSLMIGSGYCEQTAISAGFEFMSAHEFCKLGVA